MISVERGASCSEIVDSQYLSPSGWESEVPPTTSVILSAGRVRRSSPSPAVAGEYLAFEINVRVVDDRQIDSGFGYFERDFGLKQAADVGLPIRGSACPLGVSCNRLELSASQARRYLHRRRLGLARLRADRRSGVTRGAAVTATGWCRRRTGCVGRSVVGGWLGCRPWSAAHRFGLP